MTRSDYGQRAAVHGEVAPGFEAVRHAFEANFATHREIGAACCAWWQGHKVVDLWGGLRDPAAGLPWEADTLVLVFSVTKGLAALTMAIAESRGWIDIDAKVTRYWPEFAQHGKDDITVRQLLAHQAGVSAIDRPLPPSMLADLDQVADACAAQKPLWKPGTRQGYHGLVLGFFEGELIRRVDPQHRSLGRFFAEEIAEPLGVEFYIGVPDSVAPARIADISSFTPIDMLAHLHKMPWRMVLAYMLPRSITARSLRNPPAKSPGDYNKPEYRRVEFPAGGGIGTVRAVARIYSALAMGGAELGISPSVFDELIAPPKPPSRGERDLVLKVRTAFSRGFMRPSPDFRFSPNPQAMGTPGAGGAIGFADPEARLGYGYAPNKMGFSIIDDQRELAIRQAVYGCIHRMGC